MYRLLKDNSAIYVFMNWKKLGIWIDEMERAGFTVKNCIVWDKVVHGLNYMNYAYTHEFIIYAVKGDFFPRHKENHSPFWKDIWSISRNLSNNQTGEHHETAKSIEVTKVPIIHASRVGDIVLDPFVGSGTTAVAAKMLNRNYIGIELREDYCETTRQRVASTTPPLF